MDASATLISSASAEPTATVPGSSSPVVAARAQHPGIHWTDRWWPLLFALVSAPLLAVAATVAATKPFWHDEIYTILFADLPSVAVMWRAAHDGIDLAPPLNAILTHGIHAITGGPGLVATRLPALAGYLAAALVVFDLVRRRSHVVVAVSAVMVLCLSDAFRYATEARGYGLMLGLFALALWSWSEAARGLTRARNLPLLAVALGAGLWNHYFAILAFAPVAAGEAVRLARTRKVDWSMIAALTAAVVATIPLRTLVHVASGHAATYWRHAGIHDIGSTYQLLFGPLFGGILPFAGGLCALLVVAGFTLGNRASLRCEYRDVPPHEVAAGLVTVALPVGAVVLGIYGTGAYVSRYAIGGVIGVSIVMPLVVARVGSRRGFADVVLCTALFATFCGSAYRSVLAERTYRDPLASRPMLVQELAQDGPIVVGGTTEYLQLWYYANSGDSRSARLPGRSGRRSRTDGI